MRGKKSGSSAEKKDRQLSEIEAALVVRMSPHLLRWFTSHAPKKGETRTLPFQEKDGSFLYRHSELMAFDEYLAQPWPRTTGKRPRIPSGIREEIKLEANCACAVCGNINDGEAAHIRPVAETLNNHPSNLLWLCPSHHTNYDLGHRLHTSLKLETIRTIKDTFVGTKERHWRAELRTQNALWTFIKDIEDVHRKFLRINDPDLEGGLRHHAKETARAFRELVESRPPVQFTSGPADVAITFAKAVEKDSGRGRESLLDRLRSIDEQKARFLEEGTVRECPACHGEGAYGRYDVCQICDGEGVVDPEIADDLDPADFDDVQCPLCDGSGSHGRYDECPVCLGDTVIEKRLLDDLDLQQFEMIKCPRCKGKGREPDRSDCRLCGGERSVERRLLDGVDLTDFDDEECPLCGGRDSFRDYDECPICLGEKTVEKSRLDQIDLSLFDLVKCPRCRGTGNDPDVEDDCRFCRGERKVERGASEEYQPGRYRFGDAE